jgi:hypothetical protein
MPIVYTVGDMLLFNMKFIVAGELLVLIALGNQDEQLFSREDFGFV